MPLKETVYYCVVPVLLDISVLLIAICQFEILYFCVYNVVYKSISFLALYVFCLLFLLFLSVRFS